MSKWYSTRRLRKLLPIVPEEMGNGSRTKWCWIASILRDLTEALEWNLKTQTRLINLREIADLNLRGGLPLRSAGWFFYLFCLPLPSVSVSFSLYLSLTHIVAGAMNARMCHKWINLCLNHIIVFFFLLQNTSIRGSIRPWVGRSVTPAQFWRFRRACSFVWTHPHQFVMKRYFFKFRLFGLTVLPLARTRSEGISLLQLIKVDGMKTC